MGILMPDAGKIAWAVIGVLVWTKVVPKLKG